MTTVVVPFRAADPKRRLDRLAAPDRRRLAEAMLADVVAAAVPVGQVFLVAGEAAAASLPDSFTDGVTVADGVTHVPDPGRGQGAAVRAGLDAAAGLAEQGPLLVVNADLPCVLPRDLLALAGAVPAGGLAVAAAADGTTNALALAHERLFAPLYGPGSAARYAALAPSRLVEAPNLMDDVDTVDDLMRLAPRVGAHTCSVLASLRRRAA